LFFVFGLRAAFQKGIAFRLIQNQVQMKHRHIVADTRLQTQQHTPQALIGVAVQYTFQQADY